jgi:epsilon-lactone hydrolase
MAWFMFYLGSAAFATSIARLKGRRMRASWPIGFEVIARALKANAARVSRASWAEQRVKWAAMAQRSPIFVQLRFEPAEYGGVAGEWFIPNTAAAEPIVLYFHGGSFIYGSAKDTHRELIAREALAAGARVFAPEYRLAPEQPFPSAIDDALAVYRGLLESGVPASRIVIAGESAGGNLVLVTLLRARDAQLALPAGAVLASPYVDLTARDGSMLENACFDWAEVEDFDRWTEAYLQGHDARDPLASPALANLRGLPPLLVQVGSAEMLRDQVTALAERARAAGVSVDFSVYPDMIHNWHALASMFKVGQEAIDEIGAFVRRVSA